MAKSVHISLVEKAVDACIAGIEVYNKPDFRYREEAFSILMLNAWELLLKARIVQENGGRMRAIEVWEQRRQSDGTTTHRQFAKKNRSGNNMIIGLDKAAAIVQNYTNRNIDADCTANLELLKEIRDNAVHLRNVDPALSKRVQEVGSAALKNFMLATQSWFAFDLSEYNFYLMPIAFFAPTEIVESVKTNRTVAARNLLEHISRSEANQSDGDYSNTMNVELNFVRSKDARAVEVRLSSDPDAVPVTLTEDQARAIWRWDYSELIRQLRNRYTDFSQNARFHAIKVVCPRFHVHQGKVA